MCGRYVLARDTEELVRELDVDHVGWAEAPAAGYNIAPTTQVPVVIDRYDDEGHRQRELHACAWGLVPSWARDTSGAARMINARAETVADKPAFRVALARRRCLIPADGWYEWAREENGTGRQPYFITPLDGSLLAFAGLYEVWGEGPRRRVTCAIITTAAVGQLTRIHHRMPLPLSPDQWSRWLDRRQTAPALSTPDEMFVGGLELRPVDPAVGNVRNRGPELIAAVAPTPRQQVLDLS